MNGVVTGRISLKCHRVHHVTRCSYLASLLNSRVLLRLTATCFFFYDHHFVFLFFLCKVQIVVRRAFWMLLNPVHLLRLCRSSSRACLQCKDRGVALPCSWRLFVYCSRCQNRSGGQRGSVELQLSLVTDTKWLFTFRGLEVDVAV